MRRTLARAIGFFAVAFVAVVYAQQPGPAMPAPRIAVVFPMGGQLGSTVEVTVTGTEIDDVTSLMFSASEIKSEVVIAPEPLVDPKLKDKPIPKPKKGGPVSSAKFKVNIPASVKPGTYDCRVVTKGGISNPRAFVVGEKPEVVETDKPHNDVEVAQKVQLGSAIHGTLLSATDVDYYSFAAKANQRVLLHCAASSIDSRARPLVEVFDANKKRLAVNSNYRENDALADVTPISDGVLTVRVSEFAYQQGNGGPDYFYRLSISNAPWIDAVYPPAIAPTGSSNITLYGRNLPGGKIVEGTSINGKLLESLSVSITPPAGAGGQFQFHGYAPPAQALQDAFEFNLKGPGGISNPVPIYLTESKIAFEKDAGAGNDKTSSAEEIAVPGEIAGTIGKRYDKDWFQFTAKKGDVFYFELFADRIGSNMDLYYLVKNAQNLGTVVEEQDDDLEMLHPQTFFTRSGDPASAKFTAPADGKYLILVASRESNLNYGPRCIYRLKVSAPTPDFRAVVMAKSRDTPTAGLGLQGGEVAFDVFLDRRDGFNGPVIATAEGLPTGVTAKPALIGSGSKWGTLILNIAEGAAAFTGAILVKCTATISDKPISRIARPASITWGVQPAQNTPVISRLDQSLVLAIIPKKAPMRLTADLANAKVKSKDKEGKETDLKLESPIFVKPGDKLTIPVAVAWQLAEARPGPLNITLEATQPNMQNAAIGTANGGNAPAGMMVKEKNDTIVTIDVRPNALPGIYAVVLKGDTQIQIARDPAKKDQKTPANIQAYPAPLEVTVLPVSLGKFTATLPANGVIVVGKTAEMIVKVERSADYAGAFKINLQLPKDFKGVTVKDAMIPAGKDEGKLLIEVGPDAKIGGVTNVVVTATGTVHGKFGINHEVKSNFAIAAAPKK